MSKIPCSITKDILPLYYDDVCSEETKETIKEHLLTCDDCRKELNSLEADIEIPKEEINKNRNDQKMLERMASSWKHLKAKAFLKGAILTALAATVLFVGYMGLCRWNIQPVSSDIVKITNIRELADGRIVYRVNLLDAYDIRRIKYEMDNEGNFYMIPLRPIIKEKSQISLQIGEGYEQFDRKAQEKNQNGAEIKALYYGTPKDSILIWEKGMQLPKAGGEMEKLFKYDN